jgi:hypothetical protein
MDFELFLKFVIGLLYVALRGRGREGGGRSSGRELQVID